MDLLVFDMDLGKNDVSRIFVECFTSVFDDSYVDGRLYFSAKTIKGNSFRS